SIASFLDEENRKLDKLTSDSERSIALLK
ncbi:MAG: hypothetical protein RLZZ494_877, partial [Pseudomonadota bacterium]